MSTHHSVRLSLAGALALALFGGAGIAGAQTTMPQPPPPPPPPTTTTMPAQPAQPMPATPPQTAPPPQTMPPQAPSSQSGTGQSSDSGQFYQGTESTAQYPLPDSNGGTLTVNSGMPANVQQYGPPPSFTTLDTNHNGCISEDEARAYPPLDSDFLYASGQGKCISRAQYKKWVDTQGGSP